MGRLRNLLLYAVILGIGAAVVYLVVEQGRTMEVGPAVKVAQQTGSGGWEHFSLTYRENLTHPLAKLLLQILTIIITARILGYVCKKIGLPSVVGEIAAGIFLGPSFLAHYFPDYSSFLFPPESLGNLQFLSQIGLILFMFVVGMELDLNVVRKGAHEAVLVSHSSIVIPFTLGVGLSFFLYEKFVPHAIAFLPFALFMGIAMSITAFPVLARIVQERGLSRTHVGGLAITCAAVDDITAWCLLAAVIAIVKAGTIVSSLWTIALAICYVAFMLALVRPFLKRLGDVYPDRESLSKPVVALFFVILLLSAYASEVIGIHALFGAFLAGVIMPANVGFRNIFIDKVEDVALVLLLPLFFVYTGLRTQIGLLNDPGLWKWTGVIVAVAVAGKFFGSALPARALGNTWRDSLMLGALMNTRGLMELVVLNIGFDLGVLSSEIFAMMVIMALVTTVMTGPSLSLIERLMPLRRKSPELLDAEERKFKVLVPFGDPQRGRSMVRIAHAFVRRNEKAHITAMHLSPSTQLNQFNLAERERESFAPVRAEQKKMSITLETVFKATQDIDKELVEVANNGQYDLAIVGVGRSIYEGTLIGRLVGIGRRIIDPERLIDTLTGKEKLFEEAVFDDRVRMLLRELRLPIGIYVDKGLQEVNSVFVPLFGSGDSFLLPYAQKLIYNSGVHVSLVDVAGIFEQSPELLATVRAMQVASEGRLSLERRNTFDKDFLGKHDLMLVGFDSWKKTVETQSVWLEHIPSTLVMRA
ncbi:MAG: cation:proton antiporter [Flavobacteriales bacterium]|nr:cation:proton antiporter [Flavobacteriales bacterium]